MADVPKDLLAQIKSLEEQFTVPKETLDKIVTKFVKELEKGLAKEGSTIVSIRHPIPQHKVSDNL